MDDKPITYIDLFCGIGGIRIGMDRAGFKCVMSSDNDKECQKTYFANFGDAPMGDITLIGAKAIPDHDILCAGFPCQPFSISGRQRGFNDTRGTLFFDICRILNEKNPKVVFLENVKHLIYHNHGDTLAVILKSLEDLGYQVSWCILNGSDFGLPQNRERLIIIGSKTKLFDFDMIETQPRIMLKDFLDKDGDFEKADA